MTKIGNMSIYCPNCKSYYVQHLTVGSYGCVECHHRWFLESEQKGDSNIKNEEKVIYHMVQERIDNDLWIPKVSKISNKPDAIAVMRCLQFDNPDMDLRILKVTIIKEVLNN